MRNISFIFIIIIIISTVDKSIDRGKLSIC